MLRQDKYQSLYSCGGGNLSLYALSKRHMTTCVLLLRMTPRTCCVSHSLYMYDGRFPPTLHRRQQAKLLGSARLPAYCLLPSVFIDKKTRQFGGRPAHCFRGACSSTAYITSSSYVCCGSSYLLHCTKIICPCNCFITSLCAQRLRFVPDRHTHTHPHKQYFDELIYEKLSQPS